MPLISILTPAFAPAARYLPAALESVKAQELPSGWELEWIVQEDGEHPSLWHLFTDDERFHYAANDGQLGVAQTRNLALSRAAGDLVQVLDHDDVLLPGALATVIPRFLEHPIHWAIGQADDLLADGTRKPYPPDVPFGLIQPGLVNDWAREHGGNWPMHCAGLAARTTTLRALGGWAATPSDDDVNLLAAISEITLGWHEQTVTWLYRQHPQQAHRSLAWRRRSDDGRRIALQRAAAIRLAGPTFRQDEPLRLDLSDAMRVQVAPPIKG